MATIDAARLICLDETSTPTPLTSLRARAARGQRAYGRMPRGRQAAGSWLATLTVQGLGASLLVRGAVDRLVVAPFGERGLAPPGARVTSWCGTTAASTRALAHAPGLRPQAATWSSCPPTRRI